MKPTIRSTIAFIKVAHAGQKYGSDPYWTHPVQVAEKTAEIFGHDTDTYIVGLLHDVVEDTPYGEAELLAMGYSKKIVDAVLLLSKDKTLSYEANIQKIVQSKNKLAMKTKFGDNYINLNGDKSHWESTKAQKSNQKYAASMAVLASALGLKKEV